MIEYVDESTGELIDVAEPEGVARALLAQQARIEQLTTRLTMAGTALETLQEQVAERESSFVDGLTGWTWSALGPLSAETLWQRLSRWVGWLRGRYPIAEQLPRCWWRHPEIVEELTALHLAWSAAYADPAASLTAPVEWHQHYLPGFLARVRAWGVHCTDDHRARPESLYATESADDRLAFDRHVAEDVQQRRDDVTESKQRGRPREGGSASEVEHQQASRLTMAAIEELVARGEASRLGTLPDAPVAFGDRYWVAAAGAYYLRVDDDDLDDQLRRDHARLIAADAAVNKAPRDGAIGG